MLLLAQSLLWFVTPGTVCSDLGLLFPFFSSRNITKELGASCRAGYGEHLPRDRRQFNALCIHMAVGWPQNSGMGMLQISAHLCRCLLGAPTNFGKTEPLRGCLLTAGTPGRAQGGFILETSWAIIKFAPVYWHLLILVAGLCSDNKNWPGSELKIQRLSCYS